MQNMSFCRIVACCLVATGLALSPSTAPAQPGQMGQSSEWEATAFNNGRRIVRDSNGYFHAVWHSQVALPAAPTGYDCELFYAHTTEPANEPPSMAQNGKWSAPVNMTAQISAKDNRYPSIAIEYAEYDSGQWPAVNRIHVVWQAIPGDPQPPETGRYEVYYANIPVTSSQTGPPTDPAAWTAVLNLSNSETDSLVPSICINRHGAAVSNQHLHVVWQEEDVNSGGSLPLPKEDAWFSNIAYTRSTDSGASWGGPNGGWTSYPPESHHYTWDNLTKNAANAQMPTVACIQDLYAGTPRQQPSYQLGYDSSGVHVAYSEDHTWFSDPPGDFSPSVWTYYLHSPDDGVTWDAPVNLSGEYAVTESYPSIAVDMSDRPHIVTHYAYQDYSASQVFQNEPWHTGAANRIYLAGYDPTLERSFPGPIVGMFGAVKQTSFYYRLDGADTWEFIDPGFDAASDSEFPTVTLDRWMNVNVAAQLYSVETTDYEVRRAFRLNTNQPPGAYSPIPPVYASLGFDGIFTDSGDATHDDLFPNTAFKKSSMFFSPDQEPVGGNDPATDSTAGYDEVWTKIPGLGQQQAISPTLNRQVWQDGNMNYSSTVPVAVSRFSID